MAAEAVRKFFDASNWSAVNKLSEWESIFLASLRQGDHMPVALPLVERRTSDPEVAFNHRGTGHRASPLFGIPRLGFGLPSFLWRYFNVEHLVYEISCDLAPVAACKCASIGTHLDEGIDDITGELPDQGCVLSCDPLILFGGDAGYFGGNEA